MIIYKATNKINGKCYIGQTTGKLKNRRKQHLYKSKNMSNFYFHNALRTYGKDSFEWEVLCECDTKDELNEMEFHYIKQYDTYENGYNMTFGGDGIIRINISEDHKQKISDALRGENHPMYGKHLSEDHKQKISNALKGKKVSISTRKKMSESSIGKKMSEEAKLKLSLAGKGRVSHMKGKTHTKETRKILSEKSKGNESHAKIWCFHHKGKNIEIKNLQKFCIDNNYKYSKIYYRLKNGISI